MAGIVYLGVATPTGFVFLVFVVLPYLFFERRSRPAWRKLATRRYGRGGPYRRVMLAEAAQRSPWIVRAAAMSCFVLGAACLPAILVAVSMITNGDLVGGGVLVASALVLLRLWGAGMRLLEPSTDSLRSVRHATRGLVHVTFPLALASLPLALFINAFPVIDAEGVTLVVALGAFSLVCLAECALLARATHEAAARLPNGEVVRATPAIPAWMHRVIARKLVSQ